MSEHVWAQDNIVVHVAGGLDAVESERLEKHVADCPVCSQLVEETRSLEKKLAPLVRAAAPGSSLEDRIIQSLPPVKGTPTMNSWSGRRKAYLAAAAAVLLATLGAGLSALIDKGVGGTPVRLAEAVEGEQAVKALKSLRKRSNSDIASVSSADDMAKELRDETVAQLSKEGYKAENRLLSLADGFALQGLNVASEPGESKASPAATNTRKLAAPPVSQPVSGGGSSTLATLGDVTQNFKGRMFGAGGGPGPDGLHPAGTLTPDIKPSTPPPWTDNNDTSRIGGIIAGIVADKDAEKKTLVWNYTNNGTLPNLGTTFFKPGDDKAVQEDRKLATKRVAGDEVTPNDDSGFTPPAPLAKAAKRLEDATQKERSPAKVGQVIIAGNEVTQREAPQPSAPRRIIIRTGDLEFEIDSFDGSVATILKLVSAAKGSFVATINSDKLPNGKVRGAVVVRVPPELLDNFVLDLRKELSKSGELKNQRIGSQDITKQYTDLESRLRAARAMEERLLAIIKDGKGQIKDLLAAEKELGVWRTQIEGLEGELRYYGNQAAYSTLTIKLFEKDIKSAASITESERVQAGLEVEDVEKAHQEALKAILDFKGRVTRSELKQHAAGQFNAILNFEVGHDAAGPMRDRLKQLGTMVRLQVDRLQQTEDGGPAAKDGKIERGPTLFFVSIYNLANVAPRETVLLRLAAADVPAIFNKLRGVITIAKGHVINAQLDEKDRKNISAQLDFDVSRLGEGEVLTALLGAGETLTRQVNRVPENDNVTDAKVLYRLTLIDADSIQPRETVVMRIAASDVPAAYQKVAEALAKAKARVFTSQLNEQDRRNITAQLDFSLRRGDEAALQAALTGAGETLARQATRLPESPNLTDAKVLYQVTLFDVDVVQPRETLTVKIAAVDVPAAFEKLRVAVAAVKGRLLSAQINEQDRRNITAHLDITINRGDAKVLEAALAGAGETLNRQANRAPEAANVTDAKIHAVIDLIPAAAIAPRETTTLAMEVADVAATLKSFNAQVADAKGRTVETQIGKELNGQVSARVIFDVPLTVAADLAKKFENAGQVRVDRVTRDPSAPEGKLAIGRLLVTLSNTPLLVPDDQSLWSQLRSGLAFSLRGLTISAGWLIIGLLFVLPWVLVLYAAVWLAKRLWRNESAAAVVPAASASDIPPASR